MRKFLLLAPRAPQWHGRLPAEAKPKNYGCPKWQRRCVRRNASMSDSAGRAIGNVFGPNYGYTTVCDLLAGRDALSISMRTPAIVTAMAMSIVVDPTTMLITRVLDVIRR